MVDGRSPAVAVVDVERLRRSLERRVRLNRAVLDNPYWRLPVEAGHENYAQVGRGMKSSEFCGRWKSFMVCKNVDGHKGVFVGGVDVSGKVVVRHSHMWCNSSSCPVCFAHGWASRRGRSIEGRFVAAEKLGYGKVEHISASPPKEERELPEDVLRKNALRALVVRGFLGGCLVFHGFRIDAERGVLKWSPHYHALGYVRGGFDVCRNCVHERDECRSCSGFKGRHVREMEKDGWLVRVLGERRTISGTASYVLNHATIRYGIKRFRVVNWFGIMSTRALKSVKVKAESVCPACKGDMERSHYVGGRHIVKDIGSPDYVPVFFVDEFGEDGEPNYPELSGECE